MSGAGSTEYELVIDGDRFCDYDGFVEEFNRAYVPMFGGPPWDGDDLADFHEMLEGTGGRLTVRWLNSQKSAAVMGHEALKKLWVRDLEETKKRLPGFDYLHGIQQTRIDEAAAGNGKTLFEWLVFQFGDDELVNLRLE
jgi:hypothetical protein